MKASGSKFFISIFLHFLLFIQFISFCQSYAQETNLESLKKVYSNQKDTVKLETIRKIVREQILNNDSAIKYSLLGVMESQKQGHVDYEGKFFMFNSIANHNRGAYSDALLSGKSSLLKFESTSNYVWAAGICNTIAKIFVDMLEYDSAIYYQLKGLEFHNQLDVNPGTFEAMSLMAYIYEQIKEVDQALIWNKRMLRQAESNGFDYYTSEAHFNLGNVYDLLEKYDSALYHKHEALQYTSEVKINNYLELIGNIGMTHRLNQNLDSALFYSKIFYDSSWFGKKEYYRVEQKRASSAINLGVLYYDKGDMLLAEKYLLEGVTQAEKVDYKEKLIEAYHWLYLLNASKNDYQKALIYFENYANLNSKAINEENLRTIQRLAIKYDSDKKVQEISLLNLEGELKDTQLKQANLRFYSSAFGIILLGLFGYLYFNRLKYKQRAILSEEREQSQKERFRLILNTEESERKRIAKELHDGLGQLLSITRLNLSAFAEGSKSDKQLNNSLNLLDEAVTEVRSISHNMMPNALSSLGLFAAMRERVHQINDSGKFKVTLEIVNEDLKIPESISISIYRIIQEILHNAIKYSDSNSIQIHIENDVDNILIVTVSDNGKGFDQLKVGTGNGIGWKNIKSRVELINGRITIDSKPGQGTSVCLKVAIE